MTITERLAHVHGYKPEDVADGKKIIERLEDAARLYNDKFGPMATAKVLGKMSTRFVRVQLANQEDN